MGMNCDYCANSGIDPEDETKECPQCQGKGFIDDVEAFYMYGIG